MEVDETATGQGQPTLQQSDSMQFEETKMTPEEIEASNRA